MPLGAGRQNSCIRGIRSGSGRKTTACVVFQSCRSQKQKHALSQRTKGRETTVFPNPPEKHNLLFEDFLGSRRLSQREVSDHSSLVVIERCQRPAWSVHGFPELFREPVPHDTAGKFLKLQMGPQFVHLTLRLLLDMLECFRVDAELLAVQRLQLSTGLRLMWGKAHVLRTRPSELPK